MATTTTRNLLPYRGLNLAGAEFAIDAWGKPLSAGALPGTFGTHYIYPDRTYSPSYTSIDAFVRAGMTTFRLPFRWERLQPTRGAAFNAAELGRLTTTVKNLTAKGAFVVLDPHNYARYGEALIGSRAVPLAHFADFWSRLAATFKNNPKVIFGLMNEPHDLPTEQWVKAAQAGINAIRSVGATQLILVPGNGWSGADGWDANWYGTPNSIAMLAITDPQDHYAYEVHQYFDTDSSGTNPACVSPTIGRERLERFIAWLRANKKKGFLGEFGSGPGEVCLQAIDTMLTALEDAGDVMLGWTAWAGGPWTVGMLDLEPRDGAAKPQMKALLPHLSLGSEVVPPPAPTPTSTTVYPANSMAPSVGAATDDGGWNLWSNGTLKKAHRFPVGLSTLRVRARGTPLGSVWPEMVVSVGGTKLGSSAVRSSGWTDYDFRWSAATAGERTIEVAFVNDAVTSREDRNLFVQNVTVISTSADAPLPPPSPPDTPTPPPPLSPLTLKIMPLGDSITLGVNGGYRNGLWTRLVAMGWAVDFVGSETDPYAKAPDANHEGHPGFTLHDLSAQVESWLASAAPSHVLLLAGTNDVAWWTVETAAQIADRAAALIDKILAARPGVWVIVGSIPPLSNQIIEPNKVDRAVLARTYNTALEQRVLARAARGARVRWANVGGALTLGDLYDGVHPTEAAADKMAAVWFAALRSAM